MDLSRKKYVKTSTEFMYAWLAVLHLRRRSGDYSKFTGATSRPSGVPGRVLARWRQTVKLQQWCRSVDQTWSSMHECVLALLMMHPCVVFDSPGSQPRVTKHVYTWKMLDSIFLKHTAANIWKIYMLNTVQSLFPLVWTFEKTWLVHQFYMVLEPGSLKCDTLLAHTWLKRKEKKFYGMYTKPMLRTFNIIV
jgi:hypothetical protein